jgi:lipoprotein NlpI
VIGLYVQRAEIDRARSDPAASLADLAPALQRKPGDPELLAMRGQSRLESGDSAGAYADLSAASRAAPDNPVVRRAFAAWDVDAGDFDAAIRDLNARLHADPNDATAAFQRGRVWLYKGDGASAVADLTRADRDPGVLYPAIWRFLARTRLRQDGAAELAERLVAANEKWPAPVARMLLGRIDLAAAKAATSSDDDRCEADFYDAAAKVGSAPADEVAPRLEAALKECPTGFIEYEGAKAELRRLGRSGPLLGPRASRPLLRPGSTVKGARDARGPRSHFNAVASLSVRKANISSKNCFLFFSRMMLCVPSPSSTKRL